MGTIIDFEKYLLLTFVGAGGRLLENSIDVGADTHAFYQIDQATIGTCL